jgi:hypothetical protein
MDEIRHGDRSHILTLLANADRAWVLPTVLARVEAPTA